MSGDGGETLDAGQRARIALPFVAVTLIWGSTWLVIRDQLGVVPAAWSVSYRFLIATVVMLGWAAMRREPLAMAGRDHLAAAGIGVSQFMLNFNFVYAAERYITSGLVAVVFALLLVPNALFARIFLKQRVSRPFLAGSAVAMLGIALLFAHELRADAAATPTVVRGIALTMLAVLAASAANVGQAAGRMRALPIVRLMSWALIYGTAANIALAAALHGPPTMEWRWGYVAGLLYLGVMASALAFLLHFTIIRAIGPARAAYSSALIPIIAMVLSTIFEGYRWSVGAAIGSALVLAGLLWALSARRPARKSG